MSKKEIYEVLMVGCCSADPFSTILVDPRTGAAYWSFRGTELQGGISGAVEPLGRNPHHMMVSIADKPIVYAISLKSKMGSSAVRSILPVTLKHLVSHPSGSFIFGSAENRIYCWMVGTSELVSIVEDNFQAITALKISNCGSYLVSGTADGTMKAYLTTGIVNQKDHNVERVKAFTSWSAHSLSVQDIYITLGRNVRVLSVSLDQTVLLYSISSKQVLLKVSADCQLTSACMDAAETKIFLGSSSGKLCVVDIFSQCHKKEAIVNLHSANTSGSTGVDLFEHHSAEVCKLSVNIDGTRLASADKCGHYCIWDVSNGQLLVSAKMKGPVTALRFVEPWPILSDQSPRSSCNVSCAVLSKVPVVGESVIVRKQIHSAEVKENSNTLLKCSLDSLISASPSEVIKDTSAQSGKRPRLDSYGATGDDVMENADVVEIEAKQSSAKVQELEREITRSSKLILSSTISAPTCCWMMTLDLS
uniref:Uncharacterized protein n=1 Tax=Ditylenchus dipsaci TaxID=166011 RepID=A0A915EI17_9BILA